LRLKDRSQKRSPEPSHNNATDISATSQQQYLQPASPTPSESSVHTDYFALNAAVDAVHHDLPSISAALADTDNEGSTNLTDFHYITQAQLDVGCWTGRWGGLVNWPHALQVGYADAKEIGGVHEWVEDVLAHAEHGRLILRVLEGMKDWLPEEMWMIREIWRRVCELLGVVYCGIACIETRVDIVRSSPFNHLSSITL
jgi:hypothetical protein